MGYLCVLLPSVMDRVKTLTTSHVGEGPLMHSLARNQSSTMQWYAWASSPKDSCEELVWVELELESLQLLHGVVECPEHLRPWCPTAACGEKYYGELLIEEGTLPPTTG